MADGRRLPGSGLLMLLLIAGPIAGTAWWLNRPAADLPPAGPPPDEVDIVCAGRVDAEGQVVALDVGQPGRVVEVYVTEGGAVAAGQPILKVDDAAYRSAVLEAKAALTAAGVEADAAELKARQHPAQIALQEKKAAAAAAQVTAGEARLRQMKSQAEATSQVTKADVEVFEAQLTGLRLAADGERLVLDQAKRFDPTLEVRAAAARVETAKAAVERAERAAAECVLKAPAAGTVLRLTAGVGATLAPGSPVPAVVFAPAGPLVVRAELEQASLARVAEGMPVTVRDETQAESPVWAGRVRRVSGWVAPRRSVLLEPGEVNDVRTAEVVVEVDPKAGRLWIGQRVQVRISPPPAGERGASAPR
jgi:multidrug resistance efflux pump